MEIALALQLPRDGMTVPVARHIVECSMRAVGVLSPCVDDVALALTEACTNVLRHAGPGDEYDVRYMLTDRVCTITVTDLGPGFDPDAVETVPVDAESGRGMTLMRALVDRLSFVSAPGNGSTVRMDKELEYADGSLLALAVGDTDDG